MGIPYRGPDPTAADDVATKGYVDGLAWDGTQAAYDALPSKSALVTYYVTG